MPTGMEWTWHCETRSVLTMRYQLMKFGATIGAAAISLLLLSGCKTTDHKSVRIYEYGEEPPARAVNDEPTPEFQMESPGEMVSPGDDE